MSLENKLKSAAVVAAREAALRERGRVLWCIDELLKELKNDYNKKILVESQRHLSQVKMKIAGGLSSILKRRILEGHTPDGDAPYEECEMCLDKPTHYYKGAMLCRECRDEEAKDGTD